VTKHSEKTPKGKVQQTTKKNEREGTDQVAKKADLVEMRERWQNYAYRSTRDRKSGVVEVSR